jgi:hypothetical protein
MNSKLKRHTRTARMPLAAVIAKRLWLSATLAVLSAFAQPGRTAADEAVPGPGFGGSYEQAPQVLTSDPPASAPIAAPPTAKTQKPPDAPKPKKKPDAGETPNAPHDNDYTPASIKDVSVDITKEPGGKKIDLPMIHYSHADIAKYDPIHFSSQPLVLTRLDGGYIDQRLSGPVAPFCILPTYFEDDSLTRFGYTHGEFLQPLYSAAQFYVSVPLLPYFMQKRHPWDPVCPNYIPPPITFRGKAAKFYREITLDAVAVEAACITAAFFIVP